VGNDLVTEVVGFWDIRKQLKSLSINNRSFLFRSEPKSRPFIIILYTIGHTHKKKHWQNLWNNSQRIEFSFSEQLLNPFRGWNFLKDLEHSWRTYAVTGKLKHFSESQHLHSDMMEN